MYNLDEIHQAPGTGSIKWDMYDDPAIIGMNTAAMDFQPSRKITENLQAVVDRNCYDYHYKPANFGKTICSWWKRKYGWDVQENWINVAPGMWTAMNLAFLALTKPGDRAIMQSPYFYPILNIMKARGCQPVYNPMILENGNYVLDFKDFETKVRETRPSVYVLVNPHNPTGRVFTIEELAKLVDICDRYNVKIISDDVHFNYVYDGHKYTPVGSISKKAEQITVTLIAASKGYNIMDLTFAYLMAANPEIKRLLDEQDLAFSYNFATNQFGVAALMGAYSEDSDSWVAEVQAYLEANINYLDTYFKENIKRIKLIRPEGGFMCWLDCRDLGMDPVQLKEFFLTKCKVSPSWGESFGPMGEGFERLNFGTQRARVEQAAAQIKAAVDAL